MWHNLSKRSRQIAVAAAAAVALVVGVAVTASAESPGIECNGAQPHADGSFDLHCIGLVLPTAVTVTTPVPTTVTETVPVPSPTTVTITVTGPSASPTASPSPSPTASPTPTPTPSPTATVAGGCMPQPSRCGWPDQTNTGVPAGKTLRVVTGDVTVSAAGTVLDGLDIRGCVSVRAVNVTIRNSRITCGSWYAIGVQAGTGSDAWVAPGANLLVENVEIVMSSMDMKGIAFDGYTARRVWFHGGSDCAHTGQNVVVEDSFCDIPAGRSIGSAHIDGFQSDGGRNIVLRHNTIRVPYNQTSAILMSTNTSPIYDVTIVDNLVAGGGYTIYCGTDSGGAVRGTLTFSGNVVAKTYFPKGGYWGPTTSCPSTGWRWDA